MEKSANEIDQIIRNKVLDYEEEPSPKLWNRLRGRLLRKGNMLGALVIMALLSVLVFWMMKSESKQPEIIEASDLLTLEATQVKEPAKLADPIEKSQQTATQKEAVSGSEVLLRAYNNDEVVSRSRETNEKAGVVDNSVDNEVFKRYLTQAHLQFKPTRSVGVDIKSPKYDRVSYLNHIFHGIEYLPQENIGLVGMKLHRWSLSMEVGYAYSWRKVNAEPQFDDFKNMRIQNETPSNSISYDFKINYQYKNWVLSVGLGYATYGEKLNYQLSETVVDPEGGYYDVDSLWMPNYNAENNWDPILVGYNTTWVDEYKQLFYGVENTNRYRYFEIPISVGYRFNKNKCSVQPSVGISLGFLHQASGRLLMSNSGAFEDISKKSDYLQSNVNNINFELSLGYLITPNYGLYIKPFYKQGLNSIYTNYPLSALFRNAGFKMGINIYL